ncbi:MAG: hypothetical protein MK132_15005 [Lentisphaerales bacterium]|nr:hypothetical protein [Lentisphaerales bacterium]
MFFALRQHRRRQLFANILPAHIAVQIFGVATVFVAILKVFLIFNTSSTIHYKTEERKSEEVALWFLGQYLGEKYEGKSLTVVVAPPNYADQNQEIRLKGLRDGLKSRMIFEKVEVPFNKRKGKRIRRAYTYQNLDSLLKSKLKADVILLLIGFPRHYYEMEFWRAQKLPDVFSYRGQSMEIDLDIKDGLVDGFITINPNNRFKGSEENKAEMTADFFNRHFIFATPDNIDKVLNEYPALFFSPKK